MAGIVSEEMLVPTEGDQSPTSARDLVSTTDDWKELQFKCKKIEQANLRITNVDLTITGDNDIKYCFEIDEDAEAGEKLAPLERTRSHFESSSRSPQEEEPLSQDGASQQEGVGGGNRLIKSSSVGCPRRGESEPRDSPVERGTSNVPAHLGEPHLRSEGGESPPWRKPQARKLQGSCDELLPSSPVEARGDRKQSKRSILRGILKKASSASSDLIRSTS